MAIPALAAAAGLLAWGGALETPAGAAGLWAMVAAGVLLVVGPRRKALGQDGGSAGIVQGTGPDPAGLAEEHRRILASDGRCIFWNAEVVGQPGWRQMPNTCAAALKWKVYLLHTEMGRRVFGDYFESSRYEEFLYRSRPVEDQIACSARFYDAVASGQSRLTQEFRVISPVLGELWYAEDVWISEVAPDQWRCVGVCVDVTERKHLEKRSQENEQRLLRTMKASRGYVFEMDAAVPPDANTVNTDGWQWHWKRNDYEEQIARGVIEVEVPAWCRSYHEAVCHARDRDDNLRMDEMLCHAVQNGLSGYSGEYRCQNRSGGQQWLLETTRLTRMDGRRWRLNGTVLDITTQKQAQLALEENEVRLHSLMREARCVLFECDIEAISDDWETNPTPDLKWSHQNVDEVAAQGLCPITVMPGYTYLRAQWRSRLPEDRDRTDRNAARALQRGDESYSHEYRVQCSNGQIQWLSETVFLYRTGPRTWHAYGTVTNITARKEAEEGLREMMRRSHCAIWQAQITIAGDGAMTWSTDLLDEIAAQRLVPLDVAPGERYLDKWELCCDPAHERECRRRREAAARSAPSHLTLEYACTDRYGQVHWIQEETTFEPIEPGKVRGLGVCFEVTARKIAEQSLHESERRARESEMQVRQLMLQTRCMLFEQNFEAPPEWEHDPSAPVCWFRLPDDLPLDVHAAQNLLPLDLPAGVAYSLGKIERARLPEDRVRAKQVFRDAVLRKATTYTQEYRCVNRYSQVQWMAETVYVQYRSALSVHLVGTLQDITARKQAEQDLRSIMAQARCLIWSGTVLAAEDPRDMGKHQWNVAPLDLSAAQQVLELDAEDGEYARVWARSIDPQDMAERERLYAEVFAGTLTRFQQEFRCRDRHGRIQWLSEDSSYIPDGKRRWRIVGVCVNITARKQIEATLRKAPAGR